MVGYYDNIEKGQPVMVWDNNPSKAFMRKFVKTSDCDNAIYSIHGVQATAKNCVTLDEYAHGYL